MIALLFLMLTHIITDFYFQTDNSIIKKEGSISLNKPSHKTLLLHVFNYTVISSSIFLLFNSNAFNYLVVILFIFITHYIFDYLKIILNRRIKTKYDITSINKKSGLLFIIDQLLHITVLILVAFYINKEFTNNLFYDFLTKHIYYLKLVIVILLLGKPFNITFRTLFDKYKPKPKNPEAKDIGYEEEKGQVTDISNGGSLIGSLERILILICLLTNNFSTIGFVITAKSVVRFKKLDIQGFAEYFLIGTLVSIIGTLAIYHLFFSLL